VKSPSCAGVHDANKVSTLTTVSGAKMTARKKLTLPRLNPHRAAPFVPNPPRFRDLGAFSGAGCRRPPWLASCGRRFAVGRMLTSSPPHGSVRAQCRAYGYTSSIDGQSALLACMKDFSASASSRQRVPLDPLQGDPTSLDESRKRTSPEKPTVMAECYDRRRVGRHGRDRRQ